MNKFGDWTREEFSAMVKGFKKNPTSLQHSRLGVNPGTNVSFCELKLNVVHEYIGMHALGRFFRRMLVAAYIG